MIGREQRPEHGQQRLLSLLGRATSTEANDLQADIADNGQTRMREFDHLQTDIADNGQSLTRPQRLGRVGHYSEPAPRRGRHAVAALLRVQLLGSVHTHTHTHTHTH